MREAGRPLVDRYSDAELELLIEFQRRGREMHERHAQWLREQLGAHKLPEAGSLGGPIGS
jgi:hypothetical protein